ncbi:MAG: hypothetical protein J0H08_11845 [Rhizobiales bacterium]|nr:hypothetical protein [Hyphomicrobiales bacterium]
MTVTERSGPCGPSLKKIYVPGNPHESAIVCFRPFWLVASLWQVLCFNQRAKGTLNQVVVGSNSTAVIMFSADFANSINTENTSGYLAGYLEEGAAKLRAS